MNAYVKEALETAFERAQICPLLIAWGAGEVTVANRCGVSREKVVHAVGATGMDNGRMPGALEVMPATMQLGRRETATFGTRARELYWRPASA